MYRKGAIGLAVSVFVFTSCLLRSFNGSGDKGGSERGHDNAKSACPIVSEDKAKFSLCGFVDHAFKLTFRQRDSDGLYEFRDAQDFGDRFVQVFADPLVADFAKSEGITVSDVERTYKPTVTRTNFQEGFRAFLTTDAVSLETPTDSFGNFSFVLENSPKTVNVRLAKDWTFILENKKIPARTESRCLTIESLKTSSKLAANSVVLGSFNEFQFYSHVSSGSCKGEYVSTVLGTKIGFRQGDPTRIPIPKNESSDANRILSIFFNPQAGEFVLLRNLLSSSGDGSWYRPLTVFSWPVVAGSSSQMSEERLTVGQSDPVPASVISVGMRSNVSYMGVSNYADPGDAFSDWKLSFFDVTGFPKGNFALKLDDLALNDKSGPDSGVVAFPDSIGRVRVYVEYLDGAVLRSKTCFLAKEIEGFLKDCVSVPESNPVYAAKRTELGLGVATVGERIFVVGKDADGGTVLQEFNTRFVFQRMYQMSTEVLNFLKRENWRLVSDTSGLYFATIDKEYLTLYPISVSR